MNPRLVELAERTGSNWSPPMMSITCAKPMPLLTTSFIQTGARLSEEDRMRFNSRSLLE